MTGNGGGESGNSGLVTPMVRLLYVVYTVWIIGTGLLALGSIIPALFFFV